MKKMCDKCFHPKAQNKVLIKTRILALWKSYHFYLIWSFRKFDIRFLFPIASPGSAPSSSDRQLRRILIEEVSIEYVGCDRSDIVMDLIFDGSDIVVDLIL